MNTRHWSDAWGSHVELADRLDRCALRLPAVFNAGIALRCAHHNMAADLGKYDVPQLANDARDVADMAARRGEYEDYVALTDAADALDELAAQADTGVTTGEFRAIRTTVAGGASVTEYVGEDTARYAAVDMGRSDQPPELVRVWAADPDDVADDDDGVPL